MSGRLLLGCALIVGGVAWPAVSMSHGLCSFSHLYRQAAHQRAVVGRVQQTQVVTAMERGISSILGGIVVGLTGVTLVLGGIRVEPSSTANDSE